MRKIWQSGYERKTTDFTSIFSKLLLLNQGNQGSQILLGVIIPNEPEKFEEANNSKSRYHELSLFYSKRIYNPVFYHKLKHAYLCSLNHYILIYNTH